MTKEPDRLLLSSEFCCAIVSCAAAGAGGLAVGWESACIAVAGPGCADLAAMALDQTLSAFAQGAAGPNWSKARRNFHPSFDPWNNGAAGLHQAVLVPQGPCESSLLARRSQNPCPFADEAFRAVNMAAAGFIEAAGAAAEIAWLDQTPHTLATCRQDGETVLAAARLACARLEGLRIAEQARFVNAARTRPFSI